MVRFRRWLVLFLGIFCMFQTYLLVFFTRSNGSSTDKNSGAKNVVFLKTHKTAGSSVQNIFLRHAVENDLLVVLPRERYMNYIGHPKKFSSEMVPRLKSDHQYNILTHHARFDYVAIRDFMPKGSFFVTILREPSAVFESLYAFYDFPTEFGMSLEEFVATNSTQFVDLHNLRVKGRMGRNQMAFDLGVDIEQFDDEAEVRSAAVRLDDQFDLVMIAERMEESLVLLRHLLCWTVDDVVTFRQNVRQERYRVSLTSETKENILKWNMADKILYDYFYEKFEEKVAIFGKRRMAIEVEELNEKTQSMYDICVADEVEAKYITKRSHRPFSDLVLGFQLKDDSSATCKNLILPELPFTVKIKLKQHGFVYSYS